MKNSLVLVKQTIKRITNKISSNRITKKLSIRIEKVRIKYSLYITKWYENNYCIAS